MATYSFGVDGETGMVEGTYGLLQNFNRTFNTDEAVAQNAKGNVAVQELYNESTDISCEYVFDTETSVPVAGDTILIDANNFAIMNVTDNETNTGFRSVGLTLKRYTVIGVPTNP